MMMMMMMMMIREKYTPKSHRGPQLTKQTFLAA
jgi:hypothetical protein